MSGRVLSDITSSPVLLIPGKLSVLEAAELMQRARSDAGLVEAEDGSLVGILTDSDVSIKVIASGRSVQKTTVDEAMTPRPLCVRESETACRALALMAEERLRHLPILDSAGGVTGMLDIAKVLYDAITRLEAKPTTKTLSSRFPSTRSLFASEQGGVPKLSAALAGRPPPATARPGDPLSVAFEGLRSTRRSVLVVQDGKLVGILSKSDVAKRALRIQPDCLDPECLENLRVSEVMTPRPDSISSDKTVLDALHRMHDGKFANLPVLDGTVPIGVVDVLDLLRASQPPDESSSASKLFAELFAGGKAEPPQCPSPLRLTKKNDDDDDDDDWSHWSPMSSPKRGFFFSDEEELVVVGMDRTGMDRSTAGGIAIATAVEAHEKTVATPLSPPRPPRKILCAVESAKGVVEVEVEDYEGLRAMFDEDLEYHCALNSATMRVKGDKTLLAAANLHATLDSHESALPLRVVTPPRNRNHFVSLLSLVGLAALTAVALKRCS